MSDHPLTSGGLSVNAGPRLSSYRQPNLDQKYLDDWPERFDGMVVPSAAPPKVSVGGVEFHGVDSPGTEGRQTEGQADE